MSNHLKIAILTDGVFPFVMGGMQRHSHYLCRFLSHLGFEIVLVHCVPYGHNIPSEAEVKNKLDIAQDSNFKSICLNFPKSGNLPGHYLKESYAYSVKVYESIKAELSSFNMIYAKGFSAWHLLDKKRKSSNKDFPPVAVKFHGYEMFQNAADFKSKIQHWLLRGPVKFNNKHADYIFSYGGKISDIILNLGENPGKIIEIPTGISSDWIRSETEISESRTIRKFVFTGRYERRKGIEELSAILNDIKESEDFEFHFIGPIPASKKIRSDKIIYHGQLIASAELRAVLDNCEVLITPSHSEGMPNVIMEGMARGLAVIATDVGAVAAQVNSENGWLIKASEPEVLRKTIIDAIHSDNLVLLKKRIASIAKVKSQFTWEQVAKTTAEAFIRISRK